MVEAKITIQTQVWELLDALDEFYTLDLPSKNILSFFLHFFMLNAQKQNHHKKRRCAYRLSPPCVLPKMFPSCCCQVNHTTPIVCNAEGLSTASHNQANSLSRPKSDAVGPNDVEICEERGTSNSMDKSSLYNDIMPSPGLEGVAMEASMGTTEVNSEIRTRNKSTITDVMYIQNQWVHQSRQQHH